jgi:homoserine O-acetyltransferase/O-succinyltransferase
MTSDYSVFNLGDVALLSGEMLHGASLAYRTYGELNQARDNVVVLPTFYTGTHHRNEGFFGPGRAVDPARHFIVSMNLFGNGLSSSPSNAQAPNGGADFPLVHFQDNIDCQYRLLREVFDVSRVALVTGWSMAGCQSFHWGARYPDFVDAIVPFCASARTSPHNFVFLEGVKAALTADQNFNGGRYTTQPIAGLKAFGRVYAGWAFSQTFYRDEMYKERGFATVEELLVDWENDHVDNWDANNLLAKLRTWQTGDISASPTYGGDFEAALGAIKARTIVIVCDNDLYFPPEDNAIEVAHMPNAELRVFESPWGHCVASPGNEPAFATFLDTAINEVLS